MSLKKVEDDVKKSANHDNEKIMNLFHKDYQPKEYKPKKIAGAFNDNYIEYKSEDHEWFRYRRNHGTSF